jgi:glycosyltransferase involved in cell wall biosynthesis
MKILIEGWFNIPHSYAIVNDFQIIHLLKNYPDLEMYIKEEEYYRQEWKSKKKLVFGEEYNNIIKNLKVWNGEEIDLIYRITYPYNIEGNTLVNIPKCIYFTAEFKEIDPGYFAKDKLISGGQGVTDMYIKEYIKSHSNLYFTSPSTWSQNALDKYGIPVGPKHKIIPNGVDTKIFNKDFSNRESIRKFYGFESDDIIFLNIGAMTRNKGIVEILICINALVNKLKLKNVKLLLKGTEDLYETKTFLINYFKILEQNKYITKTEIDNLFANHIVFIQQTLNYPRMNDIYNACDIYLSPYNAEGFNMPALEAITTGCKLIVTENGSTDFFIKDIIENVPCAKKNIFLIESTEKQLGDGKVQLEVNCNTILKICISTIETLKTQELTQIEYLYLKEYISQKYSWDAVAKQLYNYFTEIKRK